MILFVSRYSLTHLFCVEIIIIMIIILIVVIVIEITMIIITSCYLGMTSWITVGGVGGRVFVPDRPTRPTPEVRLVPTTKTQPRLNSHQILSGRGE